MKILAFTLLICLSFSKHAALGQSPTPETSSPAADTDKIPLTPATDIPLQVPLSGSTSGQSWRDIISKTKKSVFCLVMSNDLTGEEKAGSGFIIQPVPKPNGEDPDFSYLVTNLHMVEGTRSGNLLNSDDSTYRIRGLVHADIINDIAILQVPHVDCPSLELVPIEKPTSELDVGDEIAVFGYPTYPDFIDGALSTGIVAAFVRNRNVITQSVINQFLQVTAPVSAGSSGSPVLNRRGRVVGMITKRLRKSDEESGESLGIAALAGSIQTLVKKLESWEVDRGLAVVPLQYIRRGFKPEDLLAVTTPEFRHYSEADERGERGLKHQYVKELLKIADQSALVHYQVGLTKQELALTDEAIEAFTRATMLDEKYASAWSQLGYICIQKYQKMKTDKVAGADDVLVTAVKACRNARELLDVPPTNYFLGEALLLSNQVAEARKYYETAYHQNNEDPAIVVAYFYVLGLQGDIAGAQELLPKLASMRAQFGDREKSRFENTEKKLKSR